jgi:hypothetical protein
MFLHNRMGSSLYAIPKYHRYCCLCSSEPISVCLGRHSPDFLRYCIYQFLISVYWEELICFDSFEFIGSCTQEGEILLPPKDCKSSTQSSKRQRLIQHLSPVDVTSLSQSYRQRRQKKSTINHLTTGITPVVRPASIHDHSESQYPTSQLINRELGSSLKWFVISGYLYLLGGVLLNIPWILLILFVRENIQYNPSTDTCSG